MNRDELNDLYPDAVAYLRARNVEPSDAFYARLANLRQTAWTVKRLETIEQMERVKQSLVEALANGQSFETWRKNTTAEMLALPKHYQETVFRNATLSSYNGAKWASFRDNAQHRPVLRYSAINDSRTRPAHSALHGLMMPVNDPRWQTIAPTNGHNCRCSLMSLSERQAKAFGYDGVPEKLPTYEDKHGVEHTCTPDKGWENTPENPRLLELLREREDKAGLSKAVFDSGEGKNPNGYKPVKPTTDNIADMVKYEIITKGQTDGLEHGVIVDKHGKVIDRRKGSENRIDYRDILGTGTLVGATLYHNHPSNMTLSVADITLASQSELKSILALGTTEKATYSAEIIGNWSEIYVALYASRGQLNALLTKLYTEGRASLSEVNVLRGHITALILDKKGLIDYNHNGSVSFNSLIDWHSKQIEQLIKEIK